MWYLLLTEMFTNAGVSIEFFTNAVVSAEFFRTGVSNKFLRMPFLRMGFRQIDGWTDR